MPSAFSNWSISPKFRNDFSFVFNLFFGLNFLGSIWGISFFHIVSISESKDESIDILVSFNQFLEFLKEFFKFLLLNQFRVNVRSIIIFSLNPFSVDTGKTHWWPFNFPYFRSELRLSCPNNIFIRHELKMFMKSCNSNYTP